MAGQPPSHTVRFRVVWLTAGTVLTVLATTLGPLTAGLWLARQTETRHQTYPHTGTHLELAFADLDVQLLPGKKGEIAIERQLTWSLSRPELDERWDGRTLHATAACPRIAVGPQCDVAYTLRVPPGLPITATIRAGDLTVRDTSGDLDLSASDGDIHLDNTDGQLSVHIGTDADDVAATDIRSNRVRIQTTSGDINARFTQEPEQVETTTTDGSITIGVPPHTPYNLTVDASESEIDIPHHPGARHTITTRTNTGKVRIQPTN
jgi:hypothetical protein